MYKTIIPVMIKNEKLCDEKLALSLLDVGTDMLMLALPLVLCDADATAANKARADECIKFFGKYVIKCGLWLAPTLGYGNGSAVVQGKTAADFVRKRVFDVRTGGTRDEAFCPSDKRFVAAFCECVSEYAKCDAECILLEDDFYLGNGDFREAGCCCDLHLEELYRRSGRRFTPKELSETLVSNDKEIRELWQEIKKETMLGFVSSVRGALDKVKPTMRLGISANRVTFDLDGATLKDLATVSAGKTKPLARLTGAPYWETALLSSNIESVRLESFWLKNSGIETWTEGDTHPRPRLRVPAAYLECYDQILRADGETEGILKYMLEYTSSPLYDRGYVDFHIHNKPLYRDIEKYFSGKSAAGVNICEYRELICGRVYDEAEPSAGVARYAAINAVVPPSLRMAKDNSLPTAYGAKGYASVIFGENGRYATAEDLKYGAVLDAKAALLLSERGIDVGFESAELTVPPTVEYFCDYDDRALVERATYDVEPKFYEFKLKKGAKTVSEFRYEDSLSLQARDRISRAPIPACYVYENADGQRFAVYTFVAMWACPYDVFSPWVTGLFRSVYRQKQLNSVISRVMRAPLPAVCEGNPDLFVLCKKDRDGMTVGLWNLHADAVRNAVVTLDREYRRLNATVGGTGELSGNAVKLTSEIKPYECVILDLKY